MNGDMCEILNRSPWPGVIGVVIVIWIGVCVCAFLSGTTDKKLSIYEIPSIQLTLLEY